MKKLTIAMLTIMSMTIFSAQPKKITVENMPPSVIRTVPVAGSLQVNPALKEIKITFSKTMMTKKMWSFCQESKNSFPLIDSTQIHYLQDKRTCILPVKLQSNKNYAVWINTAKFKNFRDTTNIPAIPYLLVFKTMDKKTTSIMTSAEKMALVATKKWLALVDDGNYTQSWKAASQYFKKIVPLETWVKSITAVRQPLGKVITRKLIMKKYYTSLPNAPKGKYVVIQFKTSFTNKKNVIETITPMLDKTGEWCVSGYYIK